MQRWAAAVEYDGTGFYGFQRQQQSPTIQECLEHALSKVANESLIIHCAGRTDAGVHAASQVIHFESDADRTSHNWLMGANAQLPHAISVLWVVAVPPEFHSRASAIERSYRYTIINRPIRPSIGRQQMTWIRSSLDANKMDIAAQSLVGEHDFSAFRAAGCQARHARRCIKQISVKRQSDRVCISITANAFLHHMVRNIAGSLIQVGREAEPVTWIEYLLETKTRALAGVTAPPQGLILVSIKYPEQFAIPNEGVDSGDK